jgi:RNA polymerase sigma-70 factor (ECF subfamily)
MAGAPAAAGGRLAGVDAAIAKANSMQGTGMPAATRNPGILPAQIVGKIAQDRRSRESMDCAALLTTSELAWDRHRQVTVVERAFAQAVREHEALLTGIARRMCGNEADAADLVHDTYERALRAWEHYTDRGNLRSWLVAILHNLFIDRCRKTRRTPRTETLDDVEVAAPEPSAPPTWSTVTPQQLDAALATIGAEFRRVYLLHAQGRSYDQIAAELNIAKPTVGTRLIRARRKLKDALMREIGAER